MKIAIATIAPDARQSALLAVVRPTWEAYAKRHGLPIVVVGQPPRRDHPYWGKYFSLTLPEFSKFDAVLALDNDVLINSESPLICDGWDPGKVAIADEREQFEWDEGYVSEYYRSYDYAGPDPERHQRIFNTGVMLYTRERLPYFEDVYGRWVAWRERAPEEKRRADRFKFANDQPHVSLALQAADVAQVLNPGFNRLWWSWYRQRGSAPWRAFQFYAKSSAMLEGMLPRFLSSRLARPGERTIERALQECHFLHFAGSKSPIWLFAHRPSVPLVS